MAESTLSVQFSEIQTAIRDVLGEDDKDVEDAIKDGYRLALRPPPLEGEASGHRWSFLTPETTITLWPDIATDDDVTVSGGAYDADTNSTPLTASEASFSPSMVGQDITITDDATRCVVGYTSSTVIAVAGDAQEVSDKTFSFTATGLYALPDDYGGPEGDFYYPAGSGLAKIRFRPEGILRRYHESMGITGDPTLVAIVTRKSTDAHDPGKKTRWDALFWPIPSSERILTYTYRLLVNALGDSNPYPVGGMEFGMLVKAACIAEAECRWRGGPGPKWKAFREILAAEVVADRTQNLPTNFGQIQDKSDRPANAWPRSERQYPVTKTERS